MFDSVENFLTIEDRNRSRWNVADQELDRLVTTMIEELAVSAVDPQLALFISKNIIKTIKKVSVEAENSLAEGKDAVQVIASPTPEQIENVRIVNTIWRLYWKIDSAINELSEGRYDFTAGSETLLSLANHSKEWLPNVKATLDDMMELVNTAVTPLLSEIAKSIESIIFSMHSEGEQEAKDDACFWSDELKSFVARIVKDHFTTLVCKQTVMNRLKGLSKRAVESTTNNIFLVRHTQYVDSSTLRRRLTKGLGDLESALAPLVASPGGLMSIDNCSEMIKSTKPLLMSSPEVIAKQIDGKDLTKWNMLMLAIWQRTENDLWQYSPCGPKGFIAATTHSLHNSHHVIVQNYHQWLSEVTRSKDELLTMHRYGIENYEKNTENSEFDHVYEILVKGIEILAN